MNNSEKKLSPAIKKVIDHLINITLSDTRFKWEKFWTSFASDDRPFNVVTKNNYNGFNEFLLFIMSSITGSPFYLTFNNITKMGATLRKGSKGIPLLKFGFVYYHKQTNKRLYEQYFKLLSKDEQKHYNAVPFFSNFFVFSVNDLTDLGKIKLPEIKEKETNEFTPIKTGEKILSNWHNKECKINYGGSKACYIPSLDIVQLPIKESFNNVNGFYATACHEIIHATGHENRLNRDIKNGFGDSKYSHEELIAEIGSNLLLAKHGIITKELIENSAAYLQSWLKNFKDKQQHVYSAFKDSLKAFDYVNKVLVK